jgi:hypothetical protein
MEFAIGQMWDGLGQVTQPATLRLLASEVDELVLEVRAPYYGDPAPPGGKVGEAYNQLWEYEVVEAFFLNQEDQYLELEFGPHGQHLALLLAGRRNIIRCLIRDGEKHRTLARDFQSFF